MRNCLMGLATAALLVAPAHAQYRERSRAGQVADEIARTIEETARAAGRVADSFDRSLYELRYRGPERYAVDACRPQVERYGRMRVDDVRPYGRRSFRVYGITEGYRGSAYGRYSSRYGPRSFTCTARDDGRVKVKTKRLRRY